VGSFPRGVDVNSTTNRIYVTNVNDNNVSVIDGGTNTVITTPVGSNPSGIGVDSLTNKIYVANVFGNSVSVISGFSKSVIATVTVGSTPFGIGVNP
jgi:YVTN family beta-propeller protein